MEKNASLTAVTGAAAMRIKNTSVRLGMTKISQNDLVTI